MKLSKNNREKLRCLLLHRKKNFFFYIYDVITWGKNKKALLATMSAAADMGNRGLCECFLQFS